MDNVRVLITLVIVTILALLSVFQMQLRGYDKLGRIEEWVLYVDEPENCIENEELIFSDDFYNYYLTCNQSNSYIVKSGFEELELKEALGEQLITIEDLNELIDINIVEK